VVTTHWHDDHAGGNQVYRDTFPDVVFIAHANTRADLATLGADNRRQTWQVGDAFLGRFERLLAAGLGVDSTPVTPHERLAMASTIAIGRQYLTDAPGFRETLPTLTFDDRITVHLGRRAVNIRWLGQANTRGDAVVFVPDARVIATGDLLVHPVPFAFNAYISEWLTALDSVRAAAPVAIVPGHGPVFRDLAYLDRVRGMLADIGTASRAAAARNDSLAVLRRSLTLAEHRAAVTRGDPWLEKLFTRFFLDPALARAYQEARR
jgi:glyoxylase-like metal-dependent hydrolase (beta-lactamase superfamily II)